MASSAGLSHCSCRWRRRSTAGSLATGGVGECLMPVPTTAEPAAPSSTTALPTDDREALASAAPARPARATTAAPGGPRSGRPVRWPRRRPARCAVVLAGSRLGTGGVRPRLHAESTRHEAIRGCRDRGVRPSRYSASAPAARHSGQVRAQSAPWHEAVEDVRETHLQGRTGIGPLSLCLIEATVLLDTTGRSDALPTIGRGPSFSLTGSQLPRPRPPQERCRE